MTTSQLEIRPVDATPTPPPLPSRTQSLKAAIVFDGATTVGRREPTTRQEDGPENPRFQFEFAFSAGVTDAFDKCPIKLDVDLIMNRVSQPPSHRNDWDAAVKL
jgi:hypothetical protein